MKDVKNIYKTLSALIWKEGKLYVAKCNEIELASQGKTRKEALINLKEALELYFQDEPSFAKLSALKNVSLENIRISYA
ncbi:MAG: type II toxin-antitoxin system HicB family antitoxin [bacterium]|nr:type II toxin-antitoxin system HicB family antitoxin [bacterium]